MSRCCSFVLGMLLLFAIANVLPAADEPPRNSSAPNPDRAFRLGDLNKDGKLSKEEFLKLVSNAPRLKNNPELAELIFRRLDTDGDGFLSLEEYRRIAALRQPMPPAEPKLEQKPQPKSEPATSNRPATPEEMAFFEKKIRPVLVQSCYKCHSAQSEKVKGGLVLDTREGIRRGGDLGPAVIPGDSNSLLLKAIRHQGELKMPARKLPEEVIADFERWVRLGAPDPRDGAARVVKQEIDIEKGRQFWAFQPPRKGAPPAVKDTSWPRTAIDRFLLAGLEARGLKPSPDADPHTLVRRLSFDLVGLPPAPDEVEAFLRDWNVKPRAAWEKLVDRLLASPQFGERWGRHWLDVARFAESSGKQANMGYPHAWRYRDYAIAAFNADKPYDQFLREQLAGDLLPARNDQQKAEQLIATGFLAIGSKNHNERNPLQFRLDLIDEQIEAVSTAFLGMTVACARCHDHKFDPIPTRDYYALAGFFQSTQTCYGTIFTIQSLHPSPLLTLPRNGGVAVPLPPLTPQLRAQIDRQIADLRELQRKEGTAGTVSVRAAILRLQVQNLESRFALYEADGTPKLLAMGVRDSSTPSDSRLYVRGELDQPGDTIPRGFPQVMTRNQPSIRQGSGRLELANWIASADNPLTARVMVNRVWLHLFGRGLVATPDNFGSTGQQPSNPELLDFLACSFLENGWSVKKLIRTLVLSRAYQQSSEFNARGNEIDPDNALVWRMKRRRLEAEALRDAMLAVSGKLNLTPPTGTPVAPNGEGTILITFRRRPVDSYTGEPYRSVYLPIARDLLPESLALFDFPDPTLITGERAATTIPGQSLYLMNNPFVISQAEAVAEKLLVAGASDGDRLTRAYLRFFARPPSDREKLDALEFLNRYEKLALAEKTSPEKARQAGWAALCQSLFASAEFCHR